MSKLRTVSIMLALLGLAVAPGCQNSPTSNTTNGDFYVPVVLINAATTSVAVGGTIEIAVSIGNNGTEEVGTSTAEVLLSTNATYEPNKQNHDIVLGDIAVGISIPPGLFANTTQTFTVPAGVPAGLYHVVVRADSTGGYQELNENNNDGASQATVAVAATGATLPDLFLETFTLTGTTVAAGQSLTANWQVRNTGNQAAGGFEVALYAVPEPADPLNDPVYYTLANRQLLPSQAVPSLAIGATATSGAGHTVPFPFNLPPGNYYVGAIVDPNRAVGESDEDNNTTLLNVSGATTPAPVLVTVSAPATTNLALDTAVVAASPASIDAQAPGPLTVTYKVDNTSANPAPAFAVGFYLSEDATFDAKTDRLFDVAVHLGGLAAATSTGQINRPITIDDLGAPQTGYQVIVRVDPFNEITESDETDNDNLAALPLPTFDVTNAAGGTENLGVTNLVITTTTPEVGGIVGFTFDATLSAGLTTSTFGAYLSFDATVTVADLRLETFTVESTSTVAATVSLPTTLNVGAYTLGVLADPENGVTESDETTDQLVSAPITLVAGGASSDLAPTAFTAQSDNADPADLIKTVDSLLSSITVANSGAARAGPFRVGVYLSTDRTVTIQDQLVTATYAVGGVAPGASFVANLTTALSVRFGTLAQTNYYFGAIVDDTGLIAEQFETNNGQASTTAILVR